MCMSPLLDTKVFKININVYKRNIVSNIANMGDHAITVHQWADQIDQELPTKQQSQHTLLANII